MVGSRRAFDGRWAGIHRGYDPMAEEGGGHRMCPVEESLSELSSSRILRSQSGDA